MPTFLTGALEMAAERKIGIEAVAAVAKDLRGRGVPEPRLEASVQVVRRRRPIDDALVAASGVGA